MANAKTLRASSSSRGPIIPRSYVSENKISAIACNAEKVANIPKATGEYSRESKGIAASNIACVVTVEAATVEIFLTKFILRSFME